MKIDKQLVFFSLMCEKSINWPTYLRYKNYVHETNTDLQMRENMKLYK